MVPLVMGVEAPEPNRVLAGRYKLVARMGAGGMGAIWRAEHLVLQAPVAVKLIDRDAVPDEDTMSRFLREAKAAAALRSPHVVQIIDYGLDGKTPFMVMELLEGENLAQRLKRTRRLSRQDTARILTHVARAMQRAHDAGIVHRDLKPDNVFLVKNEDEEHAKVLDFGVAKIDQSGLGPEATRTRTGSILGTPYSMSPEQAQGNKAVDHRSDLWSLGVIAFECLTGKRPFYSDGLGDLVLTICVRDLPVPSDVAPVPLGFDEWFARACARDPEQRFQSAREMTEALRESLGLDPREVGTNTPDIMIASGQLSSAPPPSEVPTIAQEGQPSSGARSRTRPDVDAATVIAPPSGADAGIPAPTEALFGTTQHEPPPRESKGGMGIVFLVAGAALVAGLIGGLMFLNRSTRDQETMTLPAPAAPPPSSEPLEKQPAKREAAREPEGEPSAEPAASTSASAAPHASAAAPLTSAAPVVVDAGAPVARQPEEAYEPPAEPETPDGGWQKPEWAMPDNEIPVIHGPEGEDRRIVIPPEPAPSAH